MKDLASYFSRHRVPAWGPRQSKFSDDLVNYS